MSLMFICQYVNLIVHSVTYFLNKKINIVSELKKKQKKCKKWKKKPFDLKLKVKKDKLQLKKKYTDKFIILILNVLL